MISYDKGNTNIYLMCVKGMVWMPQNKETIL